MKPAVLKAIGNGRLQAIRESWGAKAQPVSSLHDPLHVEVILEYRPAVETGNLRVRTAWLGFSFERSGGRYLISDVSGPAIGDVEVFS